MNILHLVQNSLPHISGSTIRSKYIFKYQKNFSNIIVLTSFLFHASKKSIEIIESVPYFRINKNISFILRKYFYKIESLNDIIYRYLNFTIGDTFQFLIISPIIKYYIKKLVNFYKIDIIHMHSHYPEGAIAIKIAKKKNIPFIYESRGFLEENIMAKAKMCKGRDLKVIHYKAEKFKKKETELMRNSDSIITLSDIMKEDLIKRKINGEKIKIIHNCADTIEQQLIAPNLKLTEKFNLKGKKVISFIGSINKYEGIEILIRAIPHLLHKFKKIKILLIGNGNLLYLNDLKILSKKLRVSEYIIHIGSIPHHKIKDYYSITDIIVLPRLNLAITRKVTPLKPLEAMTFKKLIIASDLPALRYIIHPKSTGDLFVPEDPIDLASKIIYYLHHPEEKKKIETYSRYYVEKNFSWERVVPKYEKIYLNLLTTKNVNF